MSRGRRKGRVNEVAVGWMTLELMEKNYRDETQMTDKRLICAVEIKTKPMGLITPFHLKERNQQTITNNKKMPQMISGIPITSRHSSQVHSWLFNNASSSLVPAAISPNPPKQRNASEKHTATEYRHPSPRCVFALHRVPHRGLSARHNPNTTRSIVRKGVFSVLIFWIKSVWLALIFDTNYTLCYEFSTAMFSFQLPCGIMRIHQLYWNSSFNASYCRSVMWTFKRSKNLFIFISIVFSSTLWTAMLVHHFGTHWNISSQIFKLINTLITYMPNILAVTFLTVNTNLFF